MYSQFLQVLPGCSV